MSYEKIDNKWSWDGLYDKGGGVDEYGEIELSTCDPQVSDKYSGSGCAGRLLEEGKMDY